MARPLRIEYPGAVYHVMNRGLAQQTVFYDPTDYEAFLQVVSDTHSLWGVEVFAYCLMGNHYHLCLRTPSANLGRVMRHVNGLYTQRFNRMHQRDGPLFRGRYKAIVVEAEAYLASVIRYIHLNPVQTKLVQSPEAYRWSSHAQYLTPQSAPPWLETWFAYLDGQRVNEEKDYKNDFGNAKPKHYATLRHKRCVENQTQDFPPSLRTACLEWKRLKSLGKTKANP